MPTIMFLNNLYFTAEVFIWTNICKIKKIISIVLLDYQLKSTGNKQTNMRDRSTKNEYIKTTFISYLRGIHFR